MKYKITILKYEHSESDKYPSPETVYEQMTDEDVTTEVICAVNGLSI